MGTVNLIGTDDEVNFRELADSHVVIRCYKDGSSYVEKNRTPMTDKYIGAYTSDTDMSDLINLALFGE